MASIRLRFLILCFVVTCAAGMRNETGKENNSTMSQMNSDNITSTTVVTIRPITNPTNDTQNTTSIPSTTSTTNHTSSIKPSTTMKTDVKTSTVLLTTRKASATSKPKPTTTKSNKGDGGKQNSDNTGIIILIVVIILATIIVIACYWTRRRGQRYSVDPTSRGDEANIPLSAAEPHADPVSHNGLQTFESAEATSKELQEPEAKSEVQEEQKVEADKSAAEFSAESTAPAPALDTAPATVPDGLEDKPKQAEVEQSPPAPVQSSAGEKTHDEGLVSKKASVESLKETNENNSNNWTGRDLKARDMFWDVPLHCPV